MVVAGIDFGGDLSQEWPSVESQQMADWAVCVFGHCAGVAGLYAAARGELRTAAILWRVFGVFRVRRGLGADIGAYFGAYFVGKSIGRTKLMPNVSPGKTIEGLVGGLACTAIFAYVVAQQMSYSSDYALKLVVISVGVALVSAFGDLTESMLKRRAGIKDSGRILPGHGGVLDRIDSLLAAIPVFALAYFEWLQ